MPECLGWMRSCIRMSSSPIPSPAWDQRPLGVAMPLKIERKQPEGMHVRVHGGRPGYSHVVTVNGPGKTIYIAGQLARDIDGNIVGPGDMRAQLEQTFKNLGACLEAAGA